METYQVQVRLLLGVFEYNLIPKDWRQFKITNCCLSSVRQLTFNNPRESSLVLEQTRSMQKSVATIYGNNVEERTYDVKWTILV